MWEYRRVFWMGGLWGKSATGGWKLELRIWVCQKITTCTITSHVQVSKTLLFTCAHTHTRTCEHARSGTQARAPARTHQVVRVAKYSLEGFAQHVQWTHGSLLEVEKILSLSPELRTCLLSRHSHLSTALATCLFVFLSLLIAFKFQDFFRA
jgi:hypothetical protein